jgi:predicted Zn-dependent peptidase
LSLYKKTVLPSGIKVLSEIIPNIKSFSLGFWFNVGSRDENLKNNGISHFIEHMVFKGTRKRSAKRIADDIESCGGYLNAFTSKEHTCFYARGLEDHFERSFEIIADMIQNSLFKPTEMRKEANVVIDELHDIEDNPEELIFDKFEELIFAGNNLSLPIIGTEENIKNYKQNDLHNFLDKNYSFNRLIISTSGAVDHEKVLRLIGKYFKKDLGKSLSRRISLEKHLLPSRVEYIDKEIQQVHAIIGRPTHGFKDERRTITAVLAQILGEGSSSRLFQSVRERNGIAYQINSFLNSFNDVSSFGVYLSTNNHMIEKAVSIILREFKKLRGTKVSEKELQKAKEAIKGSLIIGLESSSHRMIRMAQSELYYNRIKSIDEIIKEIDSVTTEEIIETANDLLNESSLTKIIIKSNNNPERLKSRSIGAAA